MNAADIRLASSGAARMPRTASDLKVTPETPWLGLRSFTEEVRDYFFGRDREIQELYERVVHRPLTVLFGQSGLGKTSLLRAGLIPRLGENGYQTVLVRLAYDAEAEPLQQQVLRELAAAFPAFIPVRSSAPSLWRVFHDPEFGFVGSPQARSCRPVLIFDQFEEIFTQGEEKRREESREFLESLACLVENRPPAEVRQALEQDDELAERLLLSAQPCKVLLSLRDDFLHRLERWRRQMPSMMDNRFELRLLSGPQAYLAVYKAGARRVHIADHEPGISGQKGPIAPPETARAIVRFVAGVPQDTPLEDIENVPPLLSLICEQLNARRLANGGETIQTESLEQSADEVLRTFYADALAKHPPALRAFVEDELVSESGFRESVTLDKAIAELKPEGVADPEGVLRTLVDQRLLVIEERGGVPRIEFTHDILSAVAAASRTERKEREARDKAERQLAEQRRKYLAWAAVAGVMAILSIVAIAGWVVANRKASEARKAQKDADENFTAVTKTNERIRVLLHGASLADTDAGCRAWQEDYDAAQEVQSSQSRPGATKWHEAIAYFTRALESEPGNRRAAYWLYSTLLYRGHAKGQIFVLPLQDWGGTASYSPDGLRLLTTYTVRGDTPANSVGYAQIWDAAAGQPIGEPFRHGSDITTASFSPDGSKVVTASWNNTVQLWNAANGRPLGEPLRHESHVHSVRFSPDGLKFVTACGEHGKACYAQVWDVGTRNPEGKRLTHQGFVSSATFSPDGSKIVTASGDNTAQIWDVANSKSVGKLEHKGTVNSAYFCPVGVTVATASDDTTAQVWDAATCKPLGNPLRHEREVVDASFSPDGSMIVTLCGKYDEPGYAQIWNEPFDRPADEPFRLGEYVNCVSFSPDGAMVVVACGKYGQAGYAHVWDLASRRPLGEPFGHPRVVNSASFSPDGTRIVTAGIDGSARVWEVPVGQIGLPLRHRQISFASFSADGSRVVTGSNDGTARVWDVGSGQPIGFGLGHVDRVSIASLSPDGSRILTAKGPYGPDVVRVCDVVTGRPIGKPLEHKGSVLCASFNTNGSKIATGCLDKTAWIWSVATGQCVGPLKHDGQVTSVSFSPDGSKIVTACGGLGPAVGNAQVWVASDGQRLGAALQHKDPVMSANFSPNSRNVVTASWDQTAQIWDANTGQPLSGPLRHLGGVDYASFSHDGSKVVTRCQNLAQVWDVAKGQSLGEVLRHESRVTSVVFGPTDSTVLTASEDGTGQVWEVGTGKPLGEPLRHDNGVSTVSFSTDGSKVVTACGEETARIWDIPTDEEVRKIVQVFPTDEEKKALLWGRALAGLQFNDDGDLEIMPPSERRTALARPNLPPGPWAELAQWLNTWGPNRKLSPKSRHTLREIAERERDYGSLESLESALRYDPTVPLARLMLAGLLERETATPKGTNGRLDALEGFPAPMPNEGAAAQDSARRRTAPSRIAFLRRYDLDRLPADAALWARAARILIETRDAKVGLGPRASTTREEALKAAQKAVVLDPKSADAQETLKQVQTAAAAKTARDHRPPSAKEPSP